VSSASVWEITTKFRLGKLSEASCCVAKNVPACIGKAGFQAMTVLPAHAQLAGEGDLPHRDPFDRLLAAHAKLEKVTLATVDMALFDFPIKITTGKFLDSYFLRGANISRFMNISECHYGMAL